MATRKIIAPLSAIAAMTVFFAIPGIATANTYWHQTNSEVGAKTYPEHFQSSKTREQVRTEAEVAVREGGHARFMGSNYPTTVKNNAAGKSRQEVINEMTQESPAQRNAREQAMAG